MAHVDSVCGLRRSRNRITTVPVDHDGQGLWPEDDNQTDHGVPVLIAEDGLVEGRDREGEI